MRKTPSSISNISCYDTIDSQGPHTDFPFLSKRGVLKNHIYHVY